MTIRTCEELDKPYLVVRDGETMPRAVRGWLAAEGVRTLNVVGSRESTSPGIGGRDEAFLVRVFRGIGG